MITTFGSMPSKMPKGFFKAVHFPVLAKLDEKTMDRRMLLSSGGGARDLPLSIKFATVTSYGHEGADVSGALFQVQLNPDTGVMSGDGFLLADENGRRHARLIATGAMRGNSIDLTDARARFVEDFDTGDYWIEFTQWKVGATTGVATPAFADARAEIVGELTDEELVASFGDPMEPLIVEFDEYMITVDGVDRELTASAAGVVAFDDFFIAEADAPTKIVVDANGRVYGHLAMWGSCHDGYADRCVTVPRPLDGYASFNKAGVLTERGQVETGPIFALGGHRPAKSAKTIEQAYGGIENAWADVHIVPGKLGPWLSGRVRPGVSDELLYAVRASRISGHWVNGKLKAIVSVNAEGYEVPGSGVSFDDRFSFAASGDTVELVASLPGCYDQPAEPAAEEFPVQFTLSARTQEAAVQFLRLVGPDWVFTPTSTGTTTTNVNLSVTAPSGAVDVEQIVMTLAGGTTSAAAAPEAEPTNDELADFDEWAANTLADLLAEDDELD